MLSSRKQKNNNFNKLIIMLFINIFSTNVISAPTSELENSPSLPPPAESSSSKRISILEDPQHPSALAWSVLLLADSSVLDSPSPPRRITPKSIFIAPPLQICPEGYQPDSMNRCVKDVNINQEAYFDFLLQRLNAMYGNLGNPQQSNPPSSSSSSSSPSSNGSLGPFQLNIPIVINSDKESLNPDIISEKPSITVSDDKRPENENKKQETIITVYEIEESNNNNNNNKKKKKKNNNETKPNDDKSLENEQLIPVVEIVETNPNGSEIVDYTIPIKLYNVTNNTDTKNNTVTSNKENSLNESSVSTLVVLLSPTKLQPNITEDSNKIKNQSLDKDIVNVENSSTNEEINISLPESTVTTTLSPIKIFLNSSSSTPLSSSSVSINTNTDYEDAAQVTEKDGDVIYDDNDNNKETIDYNTDEDLEEHDLEDHTEDFEESTESDYEILKHSEAGMAVTTPSRFYTTSSSTTLDVQKDKDKDDNDKISSEVHINRDFIRETTLVGLNYDKNNGSTEIDKEVELTTPLNDEDTEENTEITANAEKVTEFQTQMPVSIVDKTFDPLENINPVITIEEASLTGFIDRKTTTPGTTIFKSTTLRSTTPFIVYPSQTEIPISQSVRPLPQADIAEMMAVSSSNEAKTVLPEQESQNPIIVKPVDIKTSQEISSHNPTTQPKKVEMFSQNKQVFDYNPAPHVSSFSTHKLEDNPVIKTIDDQKIDLNKNPVNFFPNNNYQPPYNPPRDYVRFPLHDQQPSRPNYVRFPSEEANSIHTDDSKERYHNRYPPPQNNRITPAKLGSFKRPVWPIPPTWRLDRQHSRVKSTDDEDQKQNENTPMLMRFWKRMPLILDPSLINNSPNLSFSQTQSQFEPNERTGRSYSPRRVSYYQEMSPQDVTQSFIRIQR